VGAVLAAAGAVAPMASAAAASRYYLALGDSVPVANGPDSYPELLAAHYHRLTLDDLAVAGETTAAMLAGGQYQQALAFLHGHRGHVTLITIDIGGDDLAGCLYSPLTAAPYGGCEVQARATIKGDLRMILSGLRRAAPGVPLIGMSYYDPLLGDWLAGGALQAFALETVTGLKLLNGELTTLYGGARKTAAVQGAFRTTDFATQVNSPWGRIPIAVDRACSWLSITCTAGAAEGLGLDPNSLGAVQIARAFEHTIDARGSRFR
jgi:GDSL-like Lipase/Acylhydrolase family